SRIAVVRAHAAPPLLPSTPLFRSSRQRVNMESTTGYPGVGLNSGTMPGFLGTGVQSGSIQRIRDSFVDQQYRQESNKLGYWESRSEEHTSELQARFDLVCRRLLDK